jgi:uncharacterized protein YjiS (DUF1127 family)
MPAQFEMQDDVIRRGRARKSRLHDHLIRTAEARHRQAEAIARGVHRVWTKSRRALARLTNLTSRELMPAAAGKQTFRTLGRASVAEAFRRDLLRLARLVRRVVVEPYARGRRRRNAIAQLTALDDRLLADIGLKRSEIELAVDGKLARCDDRVSRPAERPMPVEERRHELALAA